MDPSERQELIDLLAEKEKQLSQIRKCVEDLNSNIEASENGNSDDGKGSSSNFEALIDTENEIKRVKDRYGETSWNLRVVDKLTSRKVQLCFSLMLMLDVCILAVELFINTQWPSCNILQKHAWSCCPALSARRLGNSGDDGCGENLVVRKDLEILCDTTDHKTVHVFSTICFAVGIFILSVFEFELFTLIFAMRKLFCYNPLYVLDLLVVTLSLVAEGMLHASVIDFDAASIIILARAWRFFRVGHGLVVSVHERDVEKIAKLRRHGGQYRETMQSIMTVLSPIDTQNV